MALAPGDQSPAGDDNLSLAGSTLPVSSTVASFVEPKAGDQQGTFKYPPHYSFPPFYTLQPNLTTRGFQQSIWASLVTSYCAFHRLFRITPSHQIFHNEALDRRLAPGDAREILQYMTTQSQAEWIDADLARSKKATREAGREEVWVWWKSAEEWAAAMAEWVEATGQRNTVLTFFELLEGENTQKEAFHGMPLEMAKSAVAVLVRRGKASVFGEGDGIGVKFYF